MVFDLFLVTTARVRLCYGTRNNIEVSAWSPPRRRHAQQYDQKKLHVNPIHTGKVKEIGRSVVSGGGGVGRDFCARRSPTVTERTRGNVAPRRNCRRPTARASLLKHRRHPIRKTHRAFYRRVRTMAAPSKMDKKKKRTSAAGETTATLSANATHAHIYSIKNNT